MRMILTDGGRRAAGFSGTADDCVVRAISIVTGRPYSLVYDECAEINAKTPKSKRRRHLKQLGSRSASHGVFTRSAIFDRYMDRLGFVWTPTMKIGSGCKVHLRDGELPMGRLVVNVSKHMCAVIDGVLHDNHDCTRGGTRCVYGYYTFKGRVA